jgi:Tol biopolymer transport system component
MGVVYLATDERLDRRVAIKALPEHLSQDGERMARFQREAKVLASLNHPNIGAIYGLEEGAGHRYLILEFVDGETLAERLAGGPVPIAESLALAKQIADALEVAHEKGVVHRDLKPANVMLTSEGVVKVLDFGLARTAEGTPSSAAIMAPDSPTVARASPTIPGVIMGTAGYMSPEQARGKAVDKRSDIFSFGCVLYEMLTGMGPFPGETVTDSLGAILHREPDWSRVPAGTPARVRDLLRTCLAKDRRNRLHDVGDARLELERAIAGQEWAHAKEARRADPSRAALVGVGLAVSVLAGSAGWLIASTSARPEAQRAAQALHLAATVPAKPELRAVVGISPDARFVVYLAWTEPEVDSVKPLGVLVVRRLDRDETTIIQGSEGAREGALSADGRWVAFAAAQDRTDKKAQLKKIALDDGRPMGAAETLCELPPGGSPTLCWSSDREIVMALPWNRTILAVSASGGEPRVVLQEEQPDAIDTFGEIRPLVEGRSILLTRWTLGSQAVKEHADVVDLASGKRTTLLDNAGAAMRTPDGYLIARRSANALIAARIDLDPLQIVGEPVTIWTGSFVGSFHTSRGGTLAMHTAPGAFAQRKLVRVDDQGNPQPIGAPMRSYGEVGVASPDGGRIAVNLDPAAVNELPTDLWVYDVSRRTFTRIPTQGPSWRCVWSPDGQRVAYSTVNNSEFSVWERRADGSGEAVKMYASPEPHLLLAPMAWSPDGRVLAVLQVDMSSNSEDVLMLERETSGTAWRASPYLNAPANEHAARFSPDGKWVLFCSVETGRHELYAQRFTGAASGGRDALAGRVQVSTNGHDGDTWWSADGKEIRFIDGDRQVMSVQVLPEPVADAEGDPKAGATAKPGLSVSLPKQLYSLKDMKARSWSWTPDGRLIGALEGDNERKNHIDLIVNFLGEVRSKVGSAK